MESYFTRCLNGPQFTVNEEFKYEFKRFTSFKKWPKNSPVYPIKLSKAGFYHTGNSDEAVCFCCGLTKSEWKVEEDPETIHRQLSPECKLLANQTESIPISPETDLEESDFIKRLKHLEIEGSLEDIAVETGQANTEANQASSIYEAGFEEILENLPEVESPTSDITPVVVQNTARTDPEVSTTNEKSCRVQELQDNKPTACVVPRSQSADQLSGHSSPNLTRDSAIVPISGLASSAQARPTSGCNINTIDARADLHQYQRLQIADPNKIKEKSSKLPTDNSANKASGKTKSSSSKKSNKKSNKGPIVTSTVSTATAPGSTTTPSMAGAAGRQNRDIPPPTGNDIGPLRFERNRLETFKKWPNSACVPPQPLARSGFHYTGSGDRVQCVFCKGILRNWEEGDQPHVEHRKHFPRCPLILGVASGNVPIPQELNNRASSGNGAGNRAMSASDSESNMRNLGIITDKPKHAQYAIEVQRLATFRHWPADKPQTPQLLAQAGFWYAGFNDNVKCFYCDGGLRNWEPGDDPWQEHARWFPKCPFVRQVKGEEFISTVQVTNEAEMPILAQVQKPKPGNVASSQKQERTEGRQSRVEEREVRARMDLQYVRNVLDMGYSRELVMKTIRKKLMETGDDFNSIQALIEAVLAMQEEEELTQSQNAPESQSEAQTGTQDVKQNGTNHASSKDNPSVNGSNSDEAEEMVEEAKSMNGSGDLMKENQELKEQKMCKICMDTDANVVFLPCGHLVSCAGCCPALSACPICRSVIKGTVRTYVA